MKKILLILSISILSVFKLTAISVSFSNIEIEQKCYDEEFVSHMGQFSGYFHHDFNQGLITGLISQAEYYFIYTTDPYLSGDLEVWAVIFNPEDFELIDWETKRYRYIGTSGQSRITVEFFVSNEEIILNREQEFNFRILQTGGQQDVSTEFTAIVIPNSAQISSISSPICGGSRTFTLQNPPDNSTITWVVQRPGTDFSGSGTSASVSFGSNPLSGQGTVIFTIDLDCQLPNIVISKIFWIGKPVFSLSGDTELEVRELGIADINYTGNSNVTNVNWSRSGAITSVTGSYVIGRYRAGSQPGYGNVYANVTNVCGSVEKTILVEVTGGWHRAYPNPANDILTIEFDKDKMPTNLKSEKVEIRLYDKMSNLKKMKSFNGFSTTINMSDLKPDVYLLQIKIGDKIIEEKIIVSER